MTGESRLSRTWNGLATRERRGLAAAATVVLLALVWLIGIQPALRTLRNAGTESTVLDAQWQAMQRQAAEAQNLRAAPKLPAGLAVQALQQASERLGAAARLSLQGDRAVLTLTGVDGDALLQWLAEARRGARARPVEASLRHGNDGYSGTLIVSVGAGS